LRSLGVGNGCDGGVGGCPRDDRRQIDQRAVGEDSGGRELGRLTADILLDQ
jgi:hypothetical protein